MGDYLVALDSLLVRATRHIRLLDHALQQQGWEHVARPALLKNFLLGGPQRRLDLLLKDGRFLQGHCALMMNLLRQHAHQVEIRLMDEHDRFDDSFVLADDDKLLHRYHFDDWRGQLDLDNRPGVYQLERRFETAWQRASSVLGYSPLGL